MTSQAAGRTALVLAVAIVALGATMGAKGAPQSSLPGDDARFLQKAAAHNHAEIELGRLAHKKAMREEVREFADRMVANHTKSNEEATTLASGTGIQLPTGPDDKHAKEMRKLEKLSGGDFDRAYMKSMLKDHHEDVESFKREAKTNKPNEVTEFASRTVPILIEHLRMAQATYDIAAGPKRADERETGSTRR